MAASITDFSEITGFLVDFRGKNHSLPSSTAKGFIEGLLATHDAATLIFDSLIISRSTALIRNGLIYHGLRITAISKVTCEQFLKILQYDRTISNEKWFDHLASICKPRTI